MKRVMPWTMATTLAVAAVVGVGAAQNPKDEVERIEKSISTLNQLTSAPDDGIPQYLLDRAEAIVVIPNLIKGGFVVGGKHGKGVISTRDRGANLWSAPAFINMTGGSIGWQVGAESVDLVLLVMNKNGVEQLLQDRFTLSGEMAAAAGPVGRNATAATNAQVNAQILAYSRAKGLFVGATLEGAGLHADKDSNRAMYGVDDVKGVLAGKKDGEAPAIVASWRETLKRLAK